MTDKKWMAVSFLVLIVFTYFLVSFVSQTITIKHITGRLKGDPRLTMSERHIVLVEQEQGHPYWQLVERGATDAAEANDIAIECIGPVRNNMAEQLKLLEKAIASKVDGIIVQGLNHEQFTPVINKAVEAGIPVITVDADAPSSKRLSFVGTDNLEAGKRQGELVVRSTGGTGKIGVIIGSDKAENQLERLEGIKQVIGGYPGLHIEEVRSSNISLIEAIQQSAEMLQRNPEITTMVGTSATDALGILQAAKSLKRSDIQIIGFDDLPETIEAIRSGQIVATIVQQPYRMGEQSVELLQRYFDGGVLSNEYFTRVEIMDAAAMAGGMNP